MQQYNEEINLLPAEIWTYLFKFVGLVGLARFRVNKHLVGIISPIINQAIHYKFFVKDFACGGDHMAVLNGENRLFISGLQGGVQPPSDGGVRELTLTNLTRHPQDESAVTRIFAGGQTLFVLTQNNYVYSKGRNSSGECAEGSRKQVDDLKHCHTFEKTVVEIGSGQQLSIALLEDGSAWGCGVNGSNCQGLDAEYPGSNEFFVTKFSPVKLYEGHSLAKISVGASHYIALDQNNFPGTMGYNNCGQMGRNSRDDKPGARGLLFNDILSFDNILMPKVRLVAAGGKSSFILTMSEKVYSCGDNAHGQLGLGDTTNRIRFCQVNFPTSTRVNQIACGESHTVILDEDNSLWGAGNNQGFAITDSEEPCYLSFTPMQTILEKINKIALLDQATACTTKFGNLFARGSNDYGRIGLGDIAQARFFSQVYQPRQLRWNELMRQRDQLEQHPKKRRCPNSTILKISFPIFIILAAILIQFRDNLAAGPQCRF